MSEIHFKVIGNPTGKQAAQAFFNPKTKKPTFFSPKNTRDWEQLIRSVAQSYAPPQLLDTPLKVVIKFTLLKPKSVPKKRTYPDKKPDIDNLEKAIFDSLQGIIFTNDSRICEKHSTKVYGNPPSVEITIEELNTFPMLSPKP